MRYPQLVHVGPRGSVLPRVFWPLVKSIVTLSGSGFKTKASVVVMLHLCPTCDPILFLWLLGLKPQIELITLSPANFHSLVLWHYSVVDGSLEEAKLAGRKKERKKVTLKSLRAEFFNGLRRRFRI